MLQAAPWFCVHSGWGGVGALSPAPTLSWPAPSELFQREHRTSERAMSCPNSPQVWWLGSGQGRRWVLGSQMEVPISVSEPVLGPTALSNLGISFSPNLTTLSALNVATFCTRAYSRTLQGPEQVHTCTRRGSPGCLSNHGVGGAIAKPVIQSGTVFLE